MLFFFNWQGEKMGLQDRDYMKEKSKRPEPKKTYNTWTPVYEETTKPEPIKEKAKPNNKQAELNKKTEPVKKYSNNSRAVTNSKPANKITVFKNILQAVMGLVIIWYWSDKIYYRMQERGQEIEFHSEGIMAKLLPRESMQETELIPGGIVLKADNQDILEEWR